MIEVAHPRPDVPANNARRPSGRLFDRALSGPRYLSCTLAVVVVLAPLVGPAWAGGSSRGKIQETRDRLDSNNSESSRDSDHDSSDDYSGHDHHHGGADDDDDNSLIGRVLLSPFWLPAAWLEDHPNRAFHHRSYPYEAGPGLHVVAPSQLGNGSNSGSTASGIDALFRFQASYERHDDHFDGRRLRCNVRTNLRVNLDGSLTRYDEALSGGRIDHLWHYKTLLTYSIAVSPRVHFSSGLGLRGVRFGDGEHFLGGVFRYSAEFFPRRPLHFWLTGEIGDGEGGAAFEGEVGLGVLVNRFEAFVGYRHFRIVGVDFAGPEVGVIAWF
ncbi:MAG: hypothetical protein MJE77_17110 [Proteobacteria bacterium]|nr:hypothetical protein [Pseudomonadota bacterium]